jgi:cytochrome P450
MGNMGHVPLQVWRFNNGVSEWLLKRIAPPDLQAFPKFLKWLESRVEGRMKNGLDERRKDMLHHFIEMNGSNSQTATKAEVMVESVVILGAGADTISHTI